MFYAPYSIVRTCYGFVSIVCEESSVFSIVPRSQLFYELLVVLVARCELYACDNRSFHKSLYIVIREEICDYPIFYVLNIFFTIGTSASKLIVNEDLWNEIPYSRLPQAFPVWNVVRYLSYFWKPQRISNVTSESRVVYVWHIKSESLAVWKWRLRLNNVGG